MVDNISNKEISQQCSDKYLFIVNPFEGFVQTHLKQSESELIIYGTLEINLEKERICPKCGRRVKIKKNLEIELIHIPIHDIPTKINIRRKQLYCEFCSKSWSQNISFKVSGHKITTLLEKHIKDSLRGGNLTIKELSRQTKVDENIIRKINKDRLIQEYTEINNKGASVLKKPAPCKILAFDEISLWKGHQYATHCVDLERSEIIWIAKGKSKQVIFDFMDFVGDEWMKGVEAVAMDMNNTFYSAFKERYSDVIIVFDHFHIVKNFNDIVISKVLNQLIRKFTKRGNTKKVKLLKGKKRLLMSSRQKLKKQDEKGKEKKLKEKESKIFNCKKKIYSKSNYTEEYNTLIQSHPLLTCIDKIKTLLDIVYTSLIEEDMQKAISEILEICKSTNNEYFRTFANLIESHYEGIIAYVKYPISTGKIEGFNSKIRRFLGGSCGIQDIEYCFFGILDLIKKKDSS